MNFTQNTIEIKLFIAPKKTAVLVQNALLRFFGGAFQQFLEGFCSQTEGGFCLEVVS